MSIRVIANGIDIYDPNRGDEYSIIEPSVKTELNKAGSFDFTVLPQHAYYAYFNKLTTYATVILDNVVLFDGRVLKIDTSFDLQKKIYCEGCLSYLVDTLAPPINDSMPAYEYFIDLITNHNNMVDDAEKSFVIGNITALNAGATIHLEEKSYTDTFSRISDTLLETAGGFLKVRTEYENNQKIHYIDWVEDPGEANQQVLQFGSNLIDLQRKVSGEDLYTILLPTGKDDIKIQGTYLYDQNRIQSYGRIYRTEKFDDVTDPEELRTLAQTYYNTGWFGERDSFSIKALDLHVIDPSVDFIELGQAIRVYSQVHGVDITLYCLRIDYDLFSPDNTSYEIGEPERPQIRGTSSGKSGKEISAQTTSTASRASGTSKRISAAEDDIDGIGKTANDILEITKRAFKLTVEDEAAMKAGTFDFNSKIFAVQSESVVVNSGGTQTTQDITQFLNGLNNNVITITGSTLWQNRDNITGVVGEMETYVDQETGLRTLRVKSGGGLKIERNGVNFGLWDQGNLTSGVIINEINEDDDLSADVVIKARRLQIDGVVTTNQIEADLALLEEVISKTGNITRITSGEVKTGDLYIDHGSGPDDYVHYMPARLSKNSVGSSWNPFDSNSNHHPWILSPTNSANVCVEHYHAITATEENQNGSPTGRITITLGASQPTSDTTNHITSFDIAATSYFQSRIAAAEGEASVTGFWIPASGSGSSKVNAAHYVNNNSNPRFINNSGTVTPVDDGKGLKSSVYLTGGDTWNGYVATVSLMSGNTLLDTIDVDASSLISSASQHDTLTKGSWSNGTIRISNTSYQSEYKDISLDVITNGAADTDSDGKIDAVSLTIWDKADATGGTPGSAGWAVAKNHNVSILNYLQGVTLDRSQWGNGTMYVYNSRNHNQKETISLSYAWAFGDDNSFSSEHIRVYGVDVTNTADGQPSSSGAEFVGNYCDIDLSSKIAEWRASGSTPGTDDVVKGNWTSGWVYVSNANNSNKNQLIRLGSTWTWSQDGNHVYVSVLDGGAVPNSTNYSDPGWLDTHLTTDIDLTTPLNSKYNQGKRDATLVKGDWTNGWVYVSNANNSSQNQLIRLGSTWTWSQDGNHLYVSVLDGGAVPNSTNYSDQGWLDTHLVTDIDLTTALNSRYSAGQLATPLYRSQWGNGQLTISNAYNSSISENVQMKYVWWFGGGSTGFSSDNIRVYGVDVSKTSNGDPSSQNAEFVGNFLEIDMGVALASKITINNPEIIWLTTDESQVGNLGYSNNLHYTVSRNGYFGIRSSGSCCGATASNNACYFRVNVAQQATTHSPNVDTVGIISGGTNHQTVISSGRENMVTTITRNQYYLLNIKVKCGGSTYTNTKYYFQVNVP